MQLNDKLNTSYLMKQNVAGFTTPPQLLVASKSYLIDRIVPNYEFISLPPVIKNPGEIHISISELPVDIIAKNNGRKARLLDRVGLFEKPIKCHDEYLYFDYRMVSPENWSHALNLHIPYAYFIYDQLAQHGLSNDIVFILPENTPKYISDLFDAFKLRTLETDATVSAVEICTRRKDWGLIQVGRHRWVKDIVKKTGIIEELKQTETKLPKKVFLSRKKTRFLTNETDVKNIVEEYGYTLIYPEDLSAKDQVALFLNAESVIAIHGAGMGPLLYAGHNLSSVIEIFTPGHMSEHYRAMCSLIGIPWLGIRANIDPEHARDAYQFSKPYRRHSLTKFTLETSTLSFTLNNIETLMAHTPQIPSPLTELN